MIMSDNPKESSVDPYLLQLLVSLETAAMQQMGKIQSPLTGKIERNIEIAKATIDMLSMLEKKTEGNLTPDEDRILKRTLYQLRMNYVDELKSDKKSDTSVADSDKQEQPDKSGTETESDSERNKPEE